MPLNTITAQKLLKKIMDKLGYNINIMNEYGEIIASGDESRIGKIHSGALEVLKEGKDMEYFDFIDNNIESAKPGVNIPLFINNEIIGVLGVTGNPKEVGKIAAIVKLTAEILIEKELDTDKKILKQTSINNYINMMISKNNEHYIPSILIWLEKNNYQIENISRIVCLIKFDNNDYLDKNRLNDYIISKIKYPADFNSQDIISYFGDNEFILIKSFDKKQYGSERSILNKFFLNLKNSFDNKLGLNFKASCGAVSKNINEISSSYEQAKFVLNWNQYSNSREVFFIEDYILEFYISVNDQSSLKMILRNVLKIIKNNSNFKETIITMSKYNMSIAKTSSKLSVHRNTIVYRMKKIKDILNLDPINNNIDRIKFHIISILLINNNKKT
ncbi:CdaR family transcriptional regulator [Brachyspira murdochii]|uniref:Transcriptional regulator, CdaR n=1 Tax=Brachyspira murdochii (strain ATCC 51284 / DSM 12563 / 56-150) TaxID=526224 RepID=D5U958_BRAM5|nr:sugar diacid recognition domain-containing protein [Brachyspira murdochii]ADG71231.1 transcriptional regulator, CdaR [Brachyspira murdochii DSM 12563]